MAEAPQAVDAQMASATAVDTRLEQAARRVRDGEAMINQQREVVFELRRNGMPAGDAEKALRASQEALFEDRKELAMLQNRQRRGLALAR